MTPSPRRQRACLARRAIPANGATVRSRLARLIPRPGMSIVPSEAGALRRPSARRPSRRSPRVVWWDSTGSFRSPGRSMRCVPVARHEKLSRASRLQGSPPPRITYRSPLADSRVFSSPTQQLPHKVKARKEIAAWPLKVKLGAEYDLIAKKFSGHADCHDSLLGGELSFDVLHSNVEYTKRFDLGDVSSIGIRARCDLSNLGSHSGSRTRMDRWDASFGFTIEPKQSRGPLGANTRVSNTRGSGYDVVTEVSLF